MSESRMKKLISSCIDWIELTSCETADARDTLVNHIGFSKDELIHFGYDYLFDTEE